MLRNPALAEQRTRKHDHSWPPPKLAPIAAATQRDKRPLRGRDTIALRVGKVINKFKMPKHFSITITEDSFTFTRNQHDIAAEAALDVFLRAAHQPARPHPRTTMWCCARRVSKSRTVLPRPQQ